MSIRHIVLLSFKASTSEEKISTIMQSLQDLQKQIPEIRAFLRIKNNSREGLDQGYKHGFMMEFNNDLERQYYLDHPLHIEVAKTIVLPELLDGTNSALVFDHEY